MRHVIGLVLVGLATGSCNPDTADETQETNTSQPVDSNDSDDASSMGSIRLMLTITGRSLVHEGACTNPNTTNDSYGYYCGNWDGVRSAISDDGRTFYLEEPTWFEHGDTMDVAWGVTQDGTWQLISSTPERGILRYTQEPGCPYFQGNGNSGSPDDTVFREVEYNGTFLQGGAPNVNSVGSENRAYYGGDEGIGLATIVNGQLIPFGQNPILRPSDFNITGLIINDPTVTQRADGTFVMYMKGAGPPDIDPNPEDHFLLRATSADGISNWVADKTPVVMSASVPGAITDRTGRVWVYFLYFGDGWSPVPLSPDQMERPYGFWELDDGSVSDIFEAVFFPAQSEVDAEYPYSFYNDPDPELMPLEGQLGYCPAETVVPRD